MIEAIRKSRNVWGAISFEHNTLTLALIKKSNRPYLFELIANGTISLTHHEYYQARLYNPSTIAQYIRTFLTKYHALHCPLTFTIQGSHITHAIKSYSALQEIENNAPKNSPLSYDYTILETDNKSEIVAYICMLDRSIIMQYQLLALRHALNLQSVATNTIAHITLYRYLANNSIMQSISFIDSISKDLTQSAHLVPDQAIANIIKIEKSITRATDYKNIGVALGSIIPLL